MSFISAGHLQQFENLIPVRKTLDDTDILIIRDGSKVFASSPDCPHKGAPLEDGAVCRGKLVCFKQKTAYDITSADVCEPPALTGLKRYATEIREGEIFVDTSVATESTGERPNRLTAVSDRAHVVIIGAGAAGSAALQTLVNNCFNGQITVIDPDQHAPYDRTLLTKAVPAGDMEPEDVPTLDAVDAMQRTEVTRLMSAVAEINTRAKRVELKDGQTVNFDRLIVATGGVPVRPDLPGVNLSGVHTLRNVEQVTHVIDDVENTNQISIVGNSFIGLEVAAALKQRNSRIRVRVIAPDPVPFENQFGSTVGQYFRNLHEGKGVEFVNDEVTAFTGAEKVTGIKLASGQFIESDLVLLATGVKTDTHLLNSLPLNNDGQINVDAYLRASEHVYAVGDIISYPYKGIPMHVEHWRTAQQQGKHAALNLLRSLGQQGELQAFDKTPYFWTKQYDDKFEYVGHAKSWDDIETVGAPGDEHFLAVFRQEGKVVAALAKGYPKLTAKMVIEMDDHVPLSSIMAKLEAA